MSASTRCRSSGTAATRRRAHRQSISSPTPASASAILGRFRGAVVVDAAIDWIKGRPAGRPWMATVSFASAHTPVMQPPAGELQSEPAYTSGLDCADQVAQRVLTNLMIESLDTEVGRLLVATGLARRGKNGELIYRPGQTDTMV